MAVARWAKHRFSPTMDPPAAGRARCVILLKADNHCLRLALFARGAGK